MVLPKETIARGAVDTCPDCGTKFELEVMRTNAYYVGTQCECGPYSRETHYFHTRAEAELALEQGTGWR